MANGDWERWKGPLDRARRKWLSGERGSLAEVKTIIGSLGASERREVAEDLRRVAASDLMNKTQFGEMLLENLRTNGKEESRRLYKKEVSHHSKSLKFNQVLGQWMVSKQWSENFVEFRIQEDPHVKECYYYRRLGWLARTKYDRRRGSPLGPSRPASDPRYRNGVFVP